MLRGKGKELMTNPMSILCVQCEDYIPLHSFQEHKKLHWATELLDVGSLKSNYTTEQLVKLRQQVIKDKKSSKVGVLSQPHLGKQIELINKAYEYLRFRPKPENPASEIATTSPTLIQDPIDGDTSEENSVEWSYKTIVGNIAAACQNQNVRWRTEMEDSCFADGVSEGNLLIDCFGVFDGHHGPQVAETCSMRFADVVKRNLISEIQSCDNDIPVEKIRAALKHSFRDMDRIVWDGRKEQSRVRWSGCSACLVLVEESRFHIANAGDVGGFLVKGDGTTVPITANHTPDQTKEKKRIEKVQGSILTSEKKLLVHGLLSSTRGIGNQGDAQLKRAVICDPDISTRAIERGDQFIILYTKGVSDVFTEKEVMLLLEEILPEDNEISLLKSHYETHGSKYDEEEDNGNASPKSDDDESSLNRDKVSAEATESSTPYDNHIKGSQASCMSEDPSDVPKLLERDSTMYAHVKATTLALEMSKRVVKGAILAGTHENVTVLTILLKDCPINLYLIPS